MEEIDISVSIVPDLSLIHISFDVYPTEKAYEVLPELQRIGTGWVDEITADMTEIEKAVFFDLLRKSAERAGKYFDNH